MGLLDDATLTLLHFDGANGSTTFSNSGWFDRPVERIGSAALSTAQSRFGGSSLSVPNASGVRTAIPKIGFSDLTAEAWVYVPTGTSAAWRGLIGLGNSTGGPSLYARGPGGGWNPRSYNFAGASDVVHQNEIPFDTWSHVALVRHNGVVRVFLNGIASTQSSVSTGPILAGTMHVGCVNDAGGENFLGFIDDARLLVGLPLYTTDFTPPTAPFLDAPTSPVVYRSVAPSVPLQQSAAGAASTPVTLKSVDQHRFLYDARDGGTGRIIGTVKEKAAPANLPLMRRVRLFQEVTGRFVRETWSDAVTGNYAFENIDATIRYTVIAYDYLNNYRAVVADNIIPETMP
jgi:hypothetical protein